MVTRSTKAPTLHHNKLWCLTNRGNPVSLHNTRKETMDAAEKHTGELWAFCALYMEARQVTVTEGWR